jgi:hypothetical protein
MARPCTVCSHRKRAEIEAAAVGGEPNRRIAPRFGLSEKSIRRHLESHVPRSLAISAEGRELAHGDTLAGQVRHLQAHADRLRARAEEDGDIRAAIAAIKTLADLVELLVKVQTTDREAKAAAHVRDVEGWAAEMAAEFGFSAEELLETAVKIADVSKRHGISEEFFGDVSKAMGWNEPQGRDT